MGKTEQKVITGNSISFATSVNEHLANGWRAVPGTIAANESTFCIVVERDNSEGTPAGK
jgi:hypothetical protein